MNPRAWSFDIPREAHLEDFAARLAGELTAPMVVYLDGPLGAGKTTFVRALATALGYSGRVKSPTYGLLERYDLKDFSLIHVDLYRIEDEAELDYLALRDLFGEDTVLLVEWPARGGGALPPADVELRFSEAVTNRSVTAAGVSPRGDRLLDACFG